MAKAYKQPKPSSVSGSRTTTRTLTKKNKIDKRTTLGGLRKKKK